MSLRRFFRRAHWNEERARELDSYLEIETAENVARGMPLETARQAARTKLGNPTLIREEIYWMNSIGFFEILVQDLRYAFRVLRKSPGFTAVAVLSLALGIGANTAVFSVVHAVLLRALPYPAPEQLVRVESGGQGAVTMLEYDFWKSNTTAFVSAAGWRGGSSRSLVSGPVHVSLTTLLVTADFFRTLGISPQLGREFNSEEMRFRAPQAIILSEGLWQRAFASDRNVLGRAVTLDDGVYTVVGVLPRGFWFPQTADAFVSLRPIGSLDDGGSNTQMMARLKTGVSMQQVQTEMTAVTANFRRAHPSDQSASYRGLSTIPYQASLVGDIRMNLLLLFGAVGLLLLITCSNLGSLLLARLAARQKEIAVRLSLGSSRSRLLQQFLTENMLLTLTGSLAGLLVAYGALHGLVGFIPFNMPISEPIRLDPPVLLFLLGIAIAVGLLFSLSPLFSASRLNVNDTLKARSRTGGDAQSGKTRTVLVVSEVALSVSLVVAAGLLIQSLYRMRQEPLGFTPQGLITFGTPITPAQQNNVDAWRRFEATLLQRIQAIPGVRSVAAVNTLPLSGPGNLPTQRVGHPENSIGGMEVRMVTPAYFETMQTPIRRGRSFRATDTPTSPPVILVNETVARAWWPQGNAIGDQVIIGRYKGREVFKDAAREVVGIVADTKSLYLKEPARPTVYISTAQASWTGGSRMWVVRANLSPGLAEDLRRVVGEIDPRQRVGRFRTMQDIVESTTATSRFDAWLFGAFGGLALVLTAIGVYGLLSFSVARRTNEIGVRMALGASRGNVLGMVLTQGVRLITIGIVIGLAGAFALTRFLASLLFGVKSTDPVSFLLGVGVLVAVGLAASYFPHAALPGWTRWLRCAGNDSSEG